MARGKEITADKLEALGARRLAELLAELSTADPVVRKAAKLALVAGQSPAKLLAEIDKRLRTIAGSKTFIDWDRRKPLVQETREPADRHYQHARPDRRPGGGGTDGGFPEPVRYPVRAR